MRLFVTRFIPFILLLMSVMASAENQDREDYFSKIYQKYNAQPTPLESWNQALNQSKNQEYTFTKGDTLWDVSKTMFGDGFFWSKVWSLNPNITNPHRVSVGQVIHFYPGSGLQSPGLSIDSSSGVPILSPSTAFGSTRWWMSQELSPIPYNLNGVVMPPPQKAYPPALQSFPDSLPGWSYKVQLKDDVPDIEIIKPERPPIRNELILPFYISSQEPSKMGEIIEMDRNALSAGDGDDLYVEAGSDFQIGKIYSVIRPLGEVKDPDGYSNSPIAYEVQGEIKIISQVDELYKAKVVRSVYPITLGATVVAGPMPKMDLSNDGKPAPIKAKVIGGENELGRIYFGQQSVIYLNRGSVDGIKVNQRAPVMENHEMRNPLTEVFGVSKRIGEVKIVKVEEDYSTAVILWGNEAILPGDFVGLPPDSEERSLRSSRDEDEEDEDTVDKRADDDDDVSSDFEDNKRDEDDEEEDEDKDKDKDEDTEKESDLDKEMSDLEDDF